MAQSGGEINRSQGAESRFPLRVVFSKIARYFIYIFKLIDLKII
jgi:hypothetical protein